MSQEQNSFELRTHPTVSEVQLSGSVSTGISVRSIIVGALLCVILALALPFNLTMVRGSFLGGDHDAPGALALFFLFVAGINLLLRLISRNAEPGSPLSRLPFNRSEMLVVYIMLVVASALCTFGLGVQLPPMITAPHYFRSPEGVTWAQTLAGANDDAHIPNWLVVSNPEAARLFYDGLGQSGSFWPRFVDILTRHWLRPLAFWAVFLFAVYGAMVCIAVIIRKQWVEREILIYPLTKVPLAIVQDPERGKLLTPLFRNRLFWMGFACPVIVATLIALKKYIPGFPVIQTIWNTYFFEKLLTLKFKIFFTAIGFAFLINLDVCFSIWALTLVALFLTALIKRFGKIPQETLDIYGVQGNPMLYHVALGAVITMVAYGLWTARDHLKDVFGKAFGRAEHVDDSAEILSYRAAVFGLIICTIVMAVWLITSGMPPWIAMLFLVIAFAIFYALTRIVAEGGLAVVQQPFLASTGLVSTLGASGVGVGGLVSMGMSYIWAAEMRTFVMAPVANGLKAIENVRRNRRRLIWAIFLAVFISFVLSTGLVIYQGYRHGGVNMSSWFFQSAPQKPLAYVYDILREKPGPNITGIYFDLVGAGLMLGLLLLRRRFAWWPLHPIGLIVMGTYIMSYVWFSFFLAWLVKGILIRYGGPRLYTKAVPLFLGFIIGQFVASSCLMSFMGANLSNLKTGLFLSLIGVFIQSG